MTTVAVLVDPPRPGLVLESLPDSTPLSTGEAAELYSAMCRDVCRAVEASGGELLVNYRADEDLPAEFTSEESAEAEVRAMLRPVLESPDDARFEVQVGSTFAGRVGNTITHLLDQEEVTTAAAVEPTAALLSRQTIDNAAMKLRRHEVVLGPAFGGRVYYAGFGDPVDFADAYAPPAVETLTERALDADCSVDFLEMQPVVETGADLVTALAQLRARERAGRLRPEHVTAYLDEIGLTVTEGADGLELDRE
jgi:hypothetical protein